jgi:tripartite-type tricarboxylate transporter receptor subunit TctC
VPSQTRYALRPAALIVAAAVLLLSCAGVASAQAYPGRPVRMVTAEAGGGNDFSARLLAPILSERLGQQFIVDNRGGAGGLIAAEIVARAPADGYTLLVYAANIWIIPLLRKHAPYDAVRDFAPITWMARSPNTLVVHPSVPASSVKELIALAKARPGQLNYASGGSGSSTHLTAELFKSMAGVSIVRVPYKGNGPAINDLVAGQTQLMFATAATVAPHAQSGRLRALAVTSAQPTPLAPGLPTVAAAGLPGFEAVSIYGIYAPARTPAAIVDLLNREVVRALARPEVKQRFFGVGMETVGDSPAEFAAVIRADIARVSKLIKEAGIRED